MPTKIPWTMETLNAHTGCSECSTGCRECFARKGSYRLECMGKEKYKGVTRKTENGIQWTGDVKFWPDVLKEPLRRKTPTTYFVNSMSDLFHPKVPFEEVDKLCEMMVDTQHLHTYKLLTKRIDRALEYAERWIDLTGEWPWGQNVHTGASICNQAEADKIIPILLQIPSAYRFISFEPLLERIELRKDAWNSVLRPCSYYCDHDADGGGHRPEHGVNQIIIGCERKHGNIAGRFQEGFIDAAIDLVRQADDAGVKVHVKQIPINGRVVTTIKDFPRELQRRET